MEKSDVCEPSALNERFCSEWKENRRECGDRRRLRSHCARANTYTAAVVNILRDTNHSGGDLL